MGTYRAHIAFPSELVAEIDQVVGRRKRSAFLVALAEKELKQIRLCAFMEEMKTNPIITDEQYPEFANGAGDWVRKIRAESEHRLQDAEARRSAE